MAFTGLRALYSAVKSLLFTDNVHRGGRPKKDWIHFHCSSCDQTVGVV